MNSHVVIFNRSALPSADGWIHIVPIHYSVPNATIYDPSAFKSFTVGQAGFLGSVRTYVAPNELWRGHLVDWSRDIKQTSSLSMRRINVN